MTAAPTLAQVDALIGRGHLADARRTLDAVLRLRPQDPGALDRLDTVAIWQQDWPTARAGLMRQVRRHSGAEARYVESHLSLLFGDLPLGWDQFEARLELPGRPHPQRDFPQPRWQGAPFPGQTLLVTWEQGFGDTLMFVRYLTRVKALGGRVLLSAQGPLADLAATCPGVDGVVPFGDPLPPFDLHVPLLSLPALFRTTLATIPAAIPYLDVPDRVPNRAALAALLAPSQGRTRVGLVWAGNPTHPRDRKRSLPPEALAPLAALPGVAWHSFQLEPGTAPPLPGLVALGPLLSTFSDTAYALSGMDLVITVDTALAHLAGALGIPTLLLVTFLPDWRWLLGREDSPWYPSLRLCRQPNPGDWDGLLRRLAAELGAP